MAGINTQFGVGIRILRSDNALEYFSSPFTNFIKQHGMIHQFSCMDTPQKNGVSKRKNLHLMEVARVLLFEMKVPIVFWVDGVLTTCFLINRMSSSVLGGNIPFSVLFPS